MAPKSTCVRSGKISASAVKRQPAGSRLISSPGCAHRPGMRRAMVIEAADSFIANVLRYMDGSRHRVHPALRALHHCRHDLGVLLTGGWPLEAAGLRRGISSSGGGPIGSAVYGASTISAPATEPNPAEDVGRRERDQGHASVQESRGAWSKGDWRSRK